MVWYSGFIQPPPPYSTTAAQPPQISQPPPQQQVPQGVFNQGARFSENSPPTIPVSRN